MSVTCTHLSVPKNTSKIYELQFTVDDLPLSIDGWTIYFTVKRNLTDSDDDAIIKKDITSHTDATNGKTQILLRR